MWRLTTRLFFFLLPTIKASMDFVAGPLVSKHYPWYSTHNLAMEWKLNAWEIASHVRNWISFNVGMQCIFVSGGTHCSSCTRRLMKIRSNSGSLYYAFLRSCQVCNHTFNPTLQHSTSYISGNVFDFCNRNMRSFLCWYLVTMHDN